MIISQQADFREISIEFEKYDAIFVDLDDTLVDYRNPCIAGLSDIKARNLELADVPLEVLEKEFREILRDNLPSLLDGKMTVDEERTMRIAEIVGRHGKRPSEEQVEEYDTIFTKSFWRERKMLQHAPEFLAMCKRLKLPIAVITNGNLNMQLRTVEMLGLNSYIDTMLTPECASDMKPGPAMFEKALEITGARRSNTIMIGDTWQHDILGAINAGLQAIWVNRRKIPIPAGYSVIEISSLSDLVWNNI